MKYLLLLLLLSGCFETSEDRGVYSNVTMKCKEAAPNNVGYYWTFCMYQAGAHRTCFRDSYKSSVQIDCSFYAAIKEDNK